MAMPFELDGRSITLIDTPGFDDTTKSDTDILKMIAGFLQTS
jgi:predicted GTPase